MLNNGELDKVFKALSDASRRAMVERLVRGPVSVSQLAEPFAMSLPAVHQHLAVLEDAGIVTSHKIGRVRTVQLAPDALTRRGRVDGPAAAPGRAPARPARRLPRADVRPTPAPTERTPP